MYRSTIKVVIALLLASVAILTVAPPRACGQVLVNDMYPYPPWAPLVGFQDTPVSVVLRNYTNEDQPVYLDIYICNTVFCTYESNLEDEGDIYYDLSGEWAVPANSYTPYHDVIIDGDLVPPGVHTVQMCATDDETFKKCKIESWYWAGAPDLELTNVSLVPPLIAGPSATVTVEIYNSGNAPAGAFWIKFIKDGTVATYAHYPYELDPEYVGSISVQVPGDFVNGQHWIVVEVDSEDNVEEWDEYNNDNWTWPAYGWWYGGQPDLVVFYISEPSSLQSGFDTNIIVEVSNEGYGDADASYVSMGLDYDVFQDARLCSGIAPREFCEVQFSIPGEYLPDGLHYILFVADSSNLVDEGQNESNNAGELWRTWSGGIPDLALTYVSEPTSLVGGVNSDITVEVRNVGYGSTGPFWLKMTVDYVQYEDSHLCSGLGVGASCWHTFTIPFNYLPDGLHSIQIVADPAPGVVYELLEDNNATDFPRTWSGGIPDLEFSNISEPSPLVGGETSTITTVISNIGYGNADPFYLEVRIDGTPYGSPYSIGGLSARSSSAPVPVPVLVEPGSHCVDLVLYNVVGEVNGTNNLGRICRYWNLGAPDGTSENTEGNLGVPLPALPPPNGTCVDMYAGNPANVTTGNKYDEVQDISISTPGIPLEFRRSYNSQLFYDGPLGYGWTHNFNMSVFVVQDTPAKRVIVWDSDGRALYFTERSRTTEILFTGEAGVRDRLRQVLSTGEYFLRRKEGNLTYKFGADGKLLQISDPNGNAINLSYPGGVLSQISDNFGKTLSIQYTGNRISSITDPKGQSVYYEYQNGNLWKVNYRDSGGNVKDLVRYEFPSSNIREKFDTNGALIGHWEYDDWKRVTRYYSHLKEGVPQEEITLAYASGNTVVTRFAENNNTYSTTYWTANINGVHVVTEIDGCSTCATPHKRFQYSNSLDITRATIVNGETEYTTQYTYDNPPNPWEQVGEILETKEATEWSISRTTSYAYSHRTDDPFLLTQSTGTRTSVVDPLQNKITTLTYDAAGNIRFKEENGYVLINGVPTQKIYTTEYQYDLGRLTQINGPRTDVSDVTNFEYYAGTVPEVYNRYQLKAITNNVNGLEIRTEFSEYDANGNVGKITKNPAYSSNEVEIQYTYDERNRVKTIRNLQTNALTQYFYDARGNLSYIILPELNEIHYAYDPANKMTEIRDGLGNKIVYGYDREGNRNREERKDPTGQLKKYLDFVYDSFGRLWKTVNPDSTFTEFSYDGRQNAISVKDPRENTTSRAFDHLNRLKEVTQAGKVLTSYGYDSQNNPTSVTDGNGNKTEYKVDDFGRKTQTTSPDTGFTKYSYDPAGNITQRIDAKGTTINYTYDALNRLTTIQFPSDSTQNVTLTYDSTSVSHGIGKLTGRVDPSGTYTFHYDAHGNLTREEKTIGSILYYTIQYDYDNNNALSSITYPSQRTVTYEPATDGTRRIATVTAIVNGQSKTLASSIQYLPFGGITDLSYGNGLLLHKGYDNQYRISPIQVGSIPNPTSILNLAYGYDANGNITSMTDARNLEGAASYTYQAGTNRLTHIEGIPSINFGYDNNGNITTENTWTYVYDLSNQLIRVLDGSNPIAEYTYNGAGQRIKKVAQGTTTIYHYDLHGHLIAETNQSGQMLAEYTYVGNQLLAMIRPGEAVYYYHNDHLGTPRVLTNESQTVVWRAVYTPFGEAEVEVATVQNPFRFPGQYYDQETGLHYNYFRYYDPTTGRYVTPDPIGLEGGINLFPYVANNPISWMDPEGLVLAYIEGYHIPTAGEFEALLTSYGLEGLPGWLKAGMYAIYADPGVPMAGGIGGCTKKVFPKTAKGMERLLKMKGTKIPDLPHTSGRNKVIFQPSDKIKIIYEQHPYHPGAPSWHKGPHWHLDIPGLKHLRYLPGDPIPGY